MNKIQKGVCLFALGSALTATTQGIKLSAPALPVVTSATLTSKSSSNIKGGQIKSPKNKAINAGDNARAQNKDKTQKNVNKIVAKNPAAAIKL